eukprot:5939101-Lingulodinium_polyedra.AAC.1
MADAEARVVVPRRVKPGHNALLTPPIYFGTTVRLPIGRDRRRGGGPRTTRGLWMDQAGCMVKLLTQ